MNRCLSQNKNKKKLRPSEEPLSEPYGCGKACLFHQLYAVGKPGFSISLSGREGSLRSKAPLWASRLVHNRLVAAACSALAALRRGRPFGKICILYAPTGAPVIVGHGASAGGRRACRSAPPRIALRPASRPQKNPPYTIIQNGQ